MNACELSSAVQALAVALAQCLSAEEYSRLALLITQLGTAMETIGGLWALCPSGGERSAEPDASAQQSVKLVNQSAECGERRVDGRGGAHIDAGKL